MSTQLFQLAAAELARRGVNPHHLNVGVLGLAALASEKHCSSIHTNFQRPAEPKRIAITTTTPATPIQTSSASPKKSKTTTP